MAPKTSQLQIRVTPSEKATLKRLARDAGQSLSSYVLGRALPREELVIARLYERLADPITEKRPVLQELAGALASAPDPDALPRVPPPPADALGPVVLNTVAGIVETSAHARGVDAPSWTADVAPLDVPHFGWALTSLKPHQLRVAPVAFKRRNLYFDPAAGPLPPPAGRAAARGSGAPGASLGADAPEHLEHLRSLADLGARLRTSDIEVEFYFLHGAVLFQAFSAQPATAHVDAMFRASGRVRSMANEVAASRGTSRHWVHEAVHALLHGGRKPLPGQVPRGYLELTGVRVFTPVPEYVLALKCAALRLGPASDDAEDLRYLARALNLLSPGAVLDAVHPYFAPRQLPTDVEATLGAVLGG